MVESYGTVPKQLRANAITTLGLIKDLGVWKTSNSLISISLKVDRGVSNSLEGGNWNGLLVNTELLKEPGWLFHSHL